MNRRTVMAGIALSAIASERSLATWIPQMSGGFQRKEATMNMIANRTQIADAKPVRGNIDEIKRLFNQLRPMERLFFRQQLYALHAKEPNVIDKTADYTYEDWLEGFDQSVIDAFESGKWKAPYC